MNQEFQDILERKEHEWKARERDLKQNISQISHGLDEKNCVLQAELRQSELQKLKIQEKYDIFVRKQQEASFRQMESAH
jgi:hypothetical protein